MTTIPRFVAAISKELAAQGFRQFSFRVGGKHPYVLVYGVSGRHTFPGTASDYRAIKNNLAELRRWLGVKKIVRKNPRNRRRVCRPRVDKTVQKIHEIAENRAQNPDKRKTLAEMVAAIVPLIPPPTIPGATKFTQEVIGPLKPLYPELERNPEYLTQISEALRGT